MKIRTWFLIIVLMLAGCGGGGLESNIVPPVSAQSPVQGSILYAFCRAPFQSGTVWILGYGTASNCSVGASTLPNEGVVLTSNGRLLNLRAKATTSAPLTVTVYVNGSPSALSCPIPAGASSCGSIGNILVGDGDEVAIGVTPNGAGAFSNIRVSVEKQ